MIAVVAWPGDRRRAERCSPFSQYSAVCTKKVNATSFVRQTGEQPSNRHGSKIYQVVNKQHQITLLARVFEEFFCNFFWQTLSTDQKATVGRSLWGGGGWQWLGVTRASNLSVPLRSYSFRVVLTLRCEPAMEWLAVVVIRCAKQIVESVFVSNGKSFYGRALQTFLLTKLLDLKPAPGSIS